MPQFDALGRDVFAAADSTFDSNAGNAVAAAVKGIWAQEGLDQGENPNHLWTVSFESDENGWSLTAALKDANVYVQPPHPDIPATEDELARGQALADPAEEPAAPITASQAATVTVPEPAPAPAEESPTDGA